MWVGVGFSFFFFFSIDCLCVYRWSIFAFGQLGVQGQLTGTGTQMAQTSPRVQHACGQAYVKNRGECGEAHFCGSMQHSVNLFGQLTHPNNSGQSMHLVVSSNVTRALMLVKPDRNNI